MCIRDRTTALDVTIQAQILELINRLKAQRNLSIIFITHDRGGVANMADRIAVMYAGKIVEYGTAEEVFYSPAHPYTWALLSSMPDLETKEKLEAIPGTPPNMILSLIHISMCIRDRIEIIIGLPATSSAYVNGYEFIVNNYTEAVKGTKLEGKLTFKKDDTIGNAFGDALRNNQVDMLFYVGWSGSEFDPYSLIEAYVSPAYQYDPCLSLIHI